MVLFILVENKACTIGICLQLCSQKWAGGESCGEAWRGGMAQTGSTGSRGSASPGTQKGRRGEMGWMNTGQWSTDWAQLRCYLEDGLLDPEGGQQNWCMPLSSLPRKGRGVGARKKRDRGRESQGTALGKFTWNLLLFSNPQILWVVCKHHPVNPFPSQRQDPPQREEHPSEPRPMLVT